MIHLPILMLVTLSAPNSYEQIFDRGLEAYNNGQYAEAINAFEQLVDNKIVDSTVFYNLGNSHYRAGNIGPAIANYERALRLDPGFLEAKENLGRSVEQTQHRLARPAPRGWERGLLFWHDSLSPRASSVGAGIAWILMWTLLAIRRIKPVPYLRRAATLSALVTAIFAASIWAKTHPQMIAVASAERVEARFGTSEKEVVYFELGEGDRVLVDRRQDGWSRVVTSDGRRGWAHDAALIFVGPPYETTPETDSEDLPE